MPSINLNLRSVSPASIFLVPFCPLPPHSHLKSHQHPPEHPLCHQGQKSLGNIATQAFHMALSACKEASCSKLGQLCWLLVGHFTSGWQAGLLFTNHSPLLPPWQPLETCQWLSAYSSPFCREWDWGTRRGNLYKDMPQEGDPRLEKLSLGSYFQRRRKRLEIWITPWQSNAFFLHQPTLKWTSRRGKCW